MKHRVQVQYTASTEIPQPDLLVKYVEDQLRKHLESNEAYQAMECDINADLDTLDYSGRVSAKIVGRLGDSDLEFRAAGYNQAPRLSGVSTHRRFAKRREWRQRNGLAMFLAWLVLEAIYGFGRCLFPSKVARAVGRPFRSGLTLQSLSDCLADIRRQLDEIADVKDVGAIGYHRQVAWLAVSVAIGGVAAAVSYYFLFDNRTPDTATRVGGLLSGAVGVSGWIYGGYLMWLPTHGLATSRAGQQLLKSLGLRTAFQLKILAIGIFVCSTGLLTFGVWAMIG